MASIGDLYFSLRGEDKQLIVDVNKAGDKAGTSFGSSMAASLKKSWSGNQIGKGLVAGLGLAGGLGAAGLFSSAISKITDVLGDATAAALEEEVSVQKLGTSLKANIPNWNGQTAAIEKVLAARMKLGFSDDEQRDSLARIVVATKDVTKALEVQRAAMDLARLRNISLADASDALIKVEGGQFRALKALGIQLPKNATATQALAAVQKAAAGQAEDYAKTNAGKLLVSQVKVDDALETLGAVTMPIVVEVMTAAADAASALANAFSDVGANVKNNEDPLQNFANLIHDLFKKPEVESRTFFGSIFDGLNGLQRGLGDASTALNDWWTFWDDHSSAGDRKAAQDFKVMEGILDRGADNISGSLGGVADASGDMADEMKADTKAVMVSWQDLKDALTATANETIDKAFDPTITAYKLSATNAEIAAAKRVLASSKASAKEKQDARETLASLAKDQASYLVDLAEAGATGTKAYKTGISALKTAIKNATGPARAALQSVLDKILEVEAAGKVVPINVRISTKTTGSGLGPGGRATGGRVKANTPYIVGERRAELYVPDTNGRIIPDVRSPEAAAAMGGVGGNTINVQLPVGPAPNPFQTADALRRMNDFGMLG